MRNLLNKEIKLSAHPLSFIFIAFGVMAMIPGYPILVGAFFVCLGIFQSFQNARENNDILYTILLPVKKSDAVKAKFIFTCFIQLCSFVLSLILTLVRMTALKNATVYTSNVMMNANQVYLAFALIIFGLFNVVFVKSFFRTAYKLKGFISFAIVGFVVITIAEALHHIPGLYFLNDTDTMGSPIMWLILVAGIVAYVLMTFAAEKKSEKLFDSVDM